MITDKEPHKLLPGECSKYAGVWYCVPPGHPELIACLGGHKVVEHLAVDGSVESISASPSILVSNGQVNEWHGYLERGEFRAC